MNPDPREQLSLVEARLFASTDLSVISAIDASADAVDAVAQLQALGMNEAEAAAVLEMPLRIRTHAERTALFHEAERLRTLL